MGLDTRLLTDWDLVGKTNLNTLRKKVQSGQHKPLYLMLCKKSESAKVKRNFMGPVRCISRSQTVNLIGEMCKENQGMDCRVLSCFFSTVCSTQNNPQMNQILAINIYLIYIYCFSGYINTAKTN